VLITGGSQGLGLQLACDLAAEGATVTIVARNEKRLQDAKATATAAAVAAGVKAPRIATFSCDVTDAATVDATVAAAIAANGAIDTLICNA
jgi:3-dehydrosphinganine reductase